MTRNYTIAELASIVGGTPNGDTNTKIAGVADVAEAGADQATWVASPKYAKLLETSRAGVVLVPSDFGDTPMPAIRCEQLDQAVARLLAAFAPPVSRPDIGVHPTAVIDESAVLGTDCRIGPHVVIDAGVRIGHSTTLHAGVFVGRDSTIGDECVIWPNAVIRDRCTIGHRVVIHPCAVIGADGFGYNFAQGRHNKIPHIGGVVLADDVEVGACTCIDRAKFGNTVIGQGTKIDNLVQLAHNIRVGEHCVFAGQVGISGSTRIGKYCVFGGAAGTVDNITIGDGARLAGGVTIATKDIPPGMTVSGFPARDHRVELREGALLRRLPKMVEQLEALLDRVKRLEESADH